MSDYIKREDAIILLQRYIFEHGFYCDTDADKHDTAELVDSLLTSTPAADVVERKRGKWREDMWITTKGYSCSECHAFTTNLSKFCPNCGADMREPPKEVDT